MDDKHGTPKSREATLLDGNPMQNKQLLLDRHLYAPDVAGGGYLDGDAVSEVILEKSSLLIYVIDTNGTTVLLNRKMRDLTGLEVEICPTGEDLLAAFYPEEGYRNVVRVIHDGWTQNRHVRDQVTLVSTIANGVRNISWSTSRLKSGGTTIGYIAMGLDHTEHKRIDRWARLQNGVLESLRDSVLICDTQGVLMAATGKAPRALGWTSEEIEGKPVNDLFTAESQATFLIEAGEEMAAKGTCSGEAELVRKNGSTVSLEISGLVLKNEHGQPIAQIYHLREPEMDDFVNQMQDLGAITSSFERRVAQLTEEVERRNKEIEKRNEELQKRYNEISEKDQKLQQIELESVELREVTSLSEAEIQRRDLELEAQARALELHAQALAERDELLKKGHADIQALQAEIEATTAGSASQVSEMQQSLEQATQREQELAAQASQREQELSQQLASREQDLSQRLAQREQELEILRAEAAGLKADVETTRMELESKTAELEQVTDDAEGLAKGLREARAETGKRLSEIENQHEEEMIAIRARLEEAAGAEKESVREELQAKAAELEEKLQSAHSQTEQTKTSGQEEIEHLREEAGRERDEKVAAVRKEMEERVQKLTSSLVSRVSELEAELEEAETDQEEAIAKLQAEWDEEREKILEEANAAKADIEQAMGDKQAKVVEASSAHDEKVEKELREKLEEAENSRLEAIADITTKKESEVADLKVQIGKLDKRISRRKADVEAKVRSEFDSELTQCNNEISGLKDQLKRAVKAGEAHARSAGALSADLGRVMETAIIVCGNDGRVLTWSIGAELLDGRNKDEAVGKLLHGDVMQVDGYDWRQIVARMAMGKRIKAPVSVMRTDGLQVPALLEAVGIRDDKGLPAGFIEVLREMSAVGKMEQQLFSERTTSLVGQLTGSIHANVEKNTGTLLKQERQLTDWAGELLKMMQLYREGGKAHYIEDLLRETDLDEIQETLPQMITNVRKAHRELFNLGSDLRRYMKGLESTDDDRYPISQAVESALNLALGPAPDVMVEREYGDVPPILGRGELFFPLLVQLLLAAREAQPDEGDAREISIRTARDEDQALVEIRHPGTLVTVSEAEELQHGYRVASDPGPGPGGLAFAVNTAKQAGGSLELDLGTAGTTIYRLLLPIDPAPMDLDEDEDSLDRFIKDRDTRSAGVKETVLTPEMVQASADEADQIIEADADIAEVEAGGATGEVEEYMRGDAQPAVIATEEEAIEAVPEEVEAIEAAPAEEEATEAAPEEAEAIEAAPSEEEAIEAEEAETPKEVEAIEAVGEEDSSEVGMDELATADEVDSEDKVVEEVATEEAPPEEVEAAEAPPEEVGNDDQAADDYEAAIMAAEADFDGFGGPSVEAPVVDEKESDPKKEKKTKKGKKSKKKSKKKTKK